MIGLYYKGFAVVKLAQQIANSLNNHYQAELYLCKYSQVSNYL